MNVGVCKISIRIPENRSLKGKRRVVNSLCSRVRNKFNVAIAEVDDNETWQLATLGFTCVGNNSRHINETLDQIISFIERNQNDFEVLGQERETVTGF